jgi:hypothetical protein
MPATHGEETDMTDAIAIEIMDEIATQRMLKLSVNIWAIIVSKRKGA